MKKDSLGDRMKNNYENRTRTYLPRRTNAIIRVDGKAFHTFTKGMERPLDSEFIDDMNQTAKYMCENIQGAKFGFVQSDEISIWLTDYDEIKTEGWFDYNLQKMCSISSSLATAKFNQLRSEKSKLKSLPLFDSRVFIIPELDEVINYFIWRQQDATRNSIQMAAQSIFSSKELHGMNMNAMQEMMFTKGVNWNDYPDGFKRGRSIVKKRNMTQRAYDLEKVRLKKILNVKLQKFDEAVIYRNQEVDIDKSLTEEDKIIRSTWEVVDPPIFTEDRGFLTTQDRSLIVKPKKIK